MSRKGSPSTRRPEVSEAAVRRAIPRYDEVLASGSAHDGAGRSVPLFAEVTPTHAAALYSAVTKYEPVECIEIGVGHGVSTMVMLAALESLGGERRLRSIDPFQSSHWQDTGRTNVERAGLARQWEMIDAPDFLALPKLVEAGESIDFAYIDGWHTFDYVLLDLFYLDKLLRTGGVYGLNDCGFPAVRRAISWLQRHRHVRELDVGLVPEYRGRNVFERVARRARGWTSQDRYFVKLESFEPNFDFYKPF